MKHLIASFICGLALASDVASALHFDLKGKRTLPDLETRESIHGSTLNDSADISYSCNITLGGVPFTVLVDTGSSDLWIAGTIPGSQDTGATSGVQYAVGSVQGPVKTNTLEFAGYTVNNQAYLEVAPDGTNPGGSGLIGLGPSAGSNIRQALNSKAGDPVLDNIFRQNTSTPNYMTVLLGRANDPSDMFPGELTVGEVLTGYENITSQSKLEVTAVGRSASGGQHWQFLLPEDGIIGPDNNVIPVTTSVGSTSDKKQATVIIDTGFTVPQVPQSVADAIYSKVPGATFGNVNGLGNIYILPCDQEINLSFKFGGVVFPIHPLDVNMDASDLGIVDSSGKGLCIGAFQPVSFALGNDPTFDIILGMAFLRNAYVLIDFGDFIDGGTDKENPYIQMLPTTNDTLEAHKDFVTVRLNGVDNGHTPNNAATTNSGKSPMATSNRKLLTYVGIGSAVVLGLLIFITLCCCSRGKKTQSTNGGFKGSSYAPLSHPAPAVDMHVVQPNQSQYNVNYQQPYAPQVPYNPSHAPGQYPSPWDNRY